jgi:K+-transporting ATPase ATPase C chain
MKTIFKTFPILRSAIVLFIGLTLVCCVIYPLITTLVGHVFFREQVQGSLVKRNGNVVGSQLIGQTFSSPRYFWGRPSATTPMPNNGVNSMGSNLGPTNPALADAVKERIKHLKDIDPDNKKPIPIDLVTTSASGVDPDISLAAAYYQLSRVAKIRGISEEQLKQLIDQQAQRPFAGFLGEPRINVLMLNLSLDQIH